MHRAGSSEQLTIRDAMILIAGVAAGLWMFQHQIRYDQLFADPAGEAWLVTAVSLLGGASTAAVPLLLIDRIRTGRRWRSSALCWLAVGLGSWSFVPALVVIRLKLARHEAAVACYAYTLPLMGLFLFTALVLGGHPPPRWWACRGRWPEWLGMWILVGWSAAGGYVLYSIYSELF